jgi:hypothetical protein
LAAAGAPWTARIGVTRRDEAPFALIHRLPSGLPIALVERAPQPAMFGSA